MLRLMCYHRNLTTPLKCIRTKSEAMKVFEVLGIYSTLKNKH